MYITDQVLVDLKQTARTGTSRLYYHNHHISYMISSAIFFTRDIANLYCNIQLSYFYLLYFCDFGLYIYIYYFLFYSNAKTDCNLQDEEMTRILDEKQKLIAEILQVRIH